MGGSQVHPEPATKADKAAHKNAALAEQDEAGDTVDSGWKGLCSAFNSIMERQLAKPEAPVLCETQVEKKLREEKAEHKEKKLLALKEKRLQDAGHVTPAFDDKAFEFKLRQMATKGVV